jgi:hypothetical protein
MTVMEKISDLVECEIQSKVSDALTKYAERISVIHKIPLSLLLRDINTSDTETMSVVCKGYTSKNTRCTRKGKHEGYCSIHFTQKREVQPIVIAQGPIKHTHGMPPLFVHDCPACMASQQAKNRNLLIDSRLIFDNE